jgi:hypothetical protein
MTDHATNVATSQPKARLLGATALIALGALAAALLPGGTPRAVAETQWPQVPADGEMGFVLTSFYPAVHQDKEDCPDGLSGTLRENFLDTVSPAEKARLLLKENEPELTSLWKATAIGPNLTNICTNAELFDRSREKLVKGTVAYGLDMDGSAASGSTCAHDEFVAEDGTTGIDNQAYRALGCSRNWRGVDGMAGDIKGFNNFLATGEHTMVIRLRGVDSLKDDAEIEVLMASTDDRPVLDSKRNFITGTSFTVNQPQWRNVTKGMIHDGVLTTLPQDMKLNRRLGHGGVRGQTSQYDLRQARLRLTFQPDGSVKGLLGAYVPPRNLIESTLVGGVGAATVAGIDCASEYHTLARLADGVKDPATGKCTAVSAAYDVAAVSAFVNDLPDAGSTKIASRP